MKTILVGTPYVIRHKKKVRLCADISLSNKIVVLYYEVNEIYGKYFCTKDSDAFLLLILEYAMLKGMDLKFQGKLTSELFYNITTYYIPVLSNNINAYKCINISAETLPAYQDRATGVATGFSAGVDSFYTVLQHIDNPGKEKQLTHVFFTNVGAQTYDHIKSQDLFIKKSLLFQEAINKLNANIQFVEVNTNCLELYQELVGKGFTGPDARKTCSCIVALKMLVGEYYFSSGLSLDKFFLSYKDPAQYDLFTINTISTLDIKFHLSGIEIEKRIEKVKKIADNSIVQQYLSVCSGKNCGKCNKCVRTQLELYALGKLGEFNKCFNLPLFSKNFVFLTAKNFALHEESKDGFNQEIINEAKKHNIKFSWYIYILSGLLFRPIYFAKDIIKNVARRYKAFEKRQQYK